MVRGGYNYRSTYWEVALGRWGLYFIDCTRGFLVSPIITCIISFIWMTFAGIFLTKTLRISGKLNSIIIMIMMISMPCFSYTLSYWYCADAYSLAMLLSILSVYFISQRGKKKFILGCICLATMLGLYQAYIGVSTGLCIIYLFVENYNQNVDFKDWGKKFRRFFFFGICGVGSYFGILEIFLNVWGTSLSSYAGANEIGIRNSFLHLPERLVHTYSAFYEWILGDGIIYNIYWKRNFLYILLLAVFFISFALLNRKVNVARFVVGMGSVLIFPVATNIIAIAAPEKDINVLLAGSMCLIIPFFLKITEMIKTDTIVKGVAVIISSLIVWSYILSNNATYLAVQTTTRQTQSIMQDIYMRVQGLDGYVPNQKIIFAGIIDESLYKRDARIYKMADGVWANMDSFWRTYDGARADWLNLYFDLMGIKQNMGTEEEYLRVISSENFKNMPVYPHRDSVSIIDGIICVKLTNEPPLP